MPDANDPEATLMELDERMSHLSSKKQTKHGYGLHFAVKHDKLAAVAVGDRSKKTYQELWDAIPEEYQRGHCFSAFWSAYQAVIRCASS